jgi:hypothetical protein
MLLERTCTRSESFISNPRICQGPVGDSMFVRKQMRRRGTGFSREEASTSMPHLSSEVPPSRLKPVPRR